MSMQIIQCTQGSDTWFRARLGIPTASEFHTVMMELKRGGVSKTRQTYMYKLAGERLTGEAAGSHLSQSMLRGKLIEDEARSYYELMTNAELKRVGFVHNPKLTCGCSPDSLVGDNGVLELKSKFPHILIELLLAGEVPLEHYAQVQGQIWLCEREWCDLLAYWPGMPHYEKRIYRDQEYIDKLAKAVAQFNEELARVVERVRRYGETPVDNLLAAG